MSSIIRRNSSFSRDYRFYEPDPVDPTQPDTDSPIDLTGQTIAFAVVIGGVRQLFSQGVTTTPLAGLVSVALSPTQTASLSVGRGEMYLLATAGGVATPKAVQAVEVRN